VGNYAAYKVPQEAMGLNALPGAPASVMADVNYPRIEGNSAAIQKFNDAVAQRPRFKPADATEESVKYTIAYAGPNLISVKFDTYDNTIGAAHPNTGLKAVNFNMATGAPLVAADMFGKPGWEAVLAKQGADGVTKKLRAEDDSARAVRPQDISKAV